MRSPSPKLITALAVVTEVGLLLAAERFSPARAPRERGATRLRRNGVLGALALGATGIFETPFSEWVAAFAAKRNWGLLPRLPMSQGSRRVAAIVALDYGIYAWHAALHRVPFLWRFHVVHHVDRECDLGTALRIHVGDIVISTFVRAVQIVALGIAPADFALWQRLFGLSVFFHHANVALPAPLERFLGYLIMTPRRHGIHHLPERALQHGNLSSGLIVWDWLHGTLREGDARRSVGLPAYSSDADAALRAMLALPFVRQRDPWSRG